MSVTRVVSYWKRAKLSSEFGEAFLRRRFDNADEILEDFGVLRSGPNKGKQAGYIVWHKVEKGGWKKDGPGYMNGHVERPGIKEVWAIRDFNDVANRMNGSNNFWPKGKAYRAMSAEEIEREKRREEELKKWEAELAKYRNGALL